MCSHTCGRGMLTNKEDCCQHHKFASIAEYRETSKIKEKSFLLIRKLSASTTACFCPPTLHVKYFFNLWLLWEVLRVLYPSVCSHMVHQAGPGLHFITHSAPCYITGINWVSLLHFHVERASNTSVSLSLFSTHAQNIFLSIIGFGLPHFRTRRSRRRAGGKNLLDLVRAIKPVKCSLVETLCWIPCFDSWLPLSFHLFLSSAAFPPKPALKLVGTAPGRCTPAVFGAGCWHAPGTALLLFPHLGAGSFCFFLWHRHFPCKGGTGRVFRESNKTSILSFCTESTFPCGLVPAFCPCIPHHFKALCLPWFCHMVLPSWGFFPYGWDTFSFLTVKN